MVITYIWIRGKSIWIYSSSGNMSLFLKLDKFKPDNIAIIDSLWNYKDGPIKSAELFKKKLIGR